MTNYACFFQPFSPGTMILSLLLIFIPECPPKVLHISAYFQVSADSSGASGRLSLTRRVWAFQKLTSTPLTSTRYTFQAIKTSVMQPRSTPPSSPISLSFAQDSLARLFQLLEGKAALTISEARSFLRSRGLLKRSDQRICSLRMLRDCFLTTTGELSRPSSPRLQSWGMVSNGLCLTASISAYRKGVSGCSLSDILEGDVEEKYFLSTSQTRFIAKLLRSGSKYVRLHQRSRPGRA